MFRILEILNFHPCDFSGGIPVSLVGKYLNTVQHAMMILEDPSVTPVQTYYSVSILIYSLIKILSLARPVCLVRSGPGPYELT